MDPIRLKQAGDRNIQRNDHFVVMAGISEDGERLVAPTFAEGGGLVVAPPTVGESAVKVVGIQETRVCTKDEASDGGYTIPAGALSVLVLFSTDFEGTINGMTFTGARGGYPDCAAPNNVMPAIAIVRTAGTYSVFEGRAS